MQGHDLPRDVHANPKSAALPGPHLGKECDRVCHFVWMEPTACISDANEDVLPVAPRAEVDSAAKFGELDGIVEQACQNLPQPRGIALDPQRLRHVRDHDLLDPRGSRIANVSERLGDSRAHVYPLYSQQPHRRFGHRLNPRQILNWLGRAVNKETVAWQIVKHAELYRLRYHPAVH